MLEATAPIKNAPSVVPKFKLRIEVVIASYQREIKEERGLGYLKQVRYTCTSGPIFLD